MKWIQLELYELQSGHRMRDGRTDGIKPIYPQQLRCAEGIITCMLSITLDYIQGCGNGIILDYVDFVCVPIHRQLDSLFKIRPDQKITYQRAALLPPWKGNAYTHWFGSWTRVAIQDSLNTCPNRLLISYQRNITKSNKWYWNITGGTLSAIFEISFLCTLRVNYIITRQIWGIW